MKREISSSLIRSSCGLVVSPSASALSLILDEIQATPVVADLDGDLARLMRRNDPHRAGRRLAGPQAFFRRFNAVVGAIAHQMGQRIADQIDQLPVKLGVGALGDEVDLFIQFIGQIADHARQVGEDALNRLHARPHHRVLQIRRHGGQALQRRLERVVLLVPA